MHFVRAIALITVLAVLSGCAVTGTRPYVFEPEEREDLISYYVVGQPYATTSSSCNDLTVSLYPSVVSGSSYMRAFIYYQNTSDETFLLQPLEALSLDVLSPDGESEAIEPRSPSDMQRRIEASKNSGLFAQALLGALSAAAVRPTTITGPGGTYEIDDTAGKYVAIADRTAAGMAITSMSSHMLSDAVSSHVLRRHTLFPGAGIGGFVYFPQSGLSGPTPLSGRSLSRAVRDRRFTLSIETACGCETISFTPVEGE